jgi:hypothetical protein
MIFGTLRVALQNDIAQVIQRTEGLSVLRKHESRSDTPFPSSNDLEYQLKPILEEHSFAHHVRCASAETSLGFEYDFFREQDGTAIEVMGYRADDEVYKDLIKFHVHSQTRSALLWVPRWKWISGRRHSVNYQSTLRALEFASPRIDVDALVVLPYDWEREGLGWLLRYSGE